MSQSGEWFKKTHKVTPATSFTVTKDLGESDAQTIWYNSRFYRVNFLWEKGSMMIREVKDDKPLKYYYESRSNEYYYTFDPEKKSDMVTISSRAVLNEEYCAF